MRNPECIDCVCFRADFSSLDFFFNFREEGGGGICATKNVSHTVFTCTFFCSSGAKTRVSFLSLSLFWNTHLLELIWIKVVCWIYIKFYFTNQNYILHWCEKYALTKIKLGLNTVIIQGDIQDRYFVHYFPLRILAADFNDIDKTKFHCHFFF